MHKTLRGHPLPGPVAATRAVECLAATYTAAGPPTDQPTHIAGSWTKRRYSGSPDDSAMLWRRRYVADYAPLAEAAAPVAAAAAAAATAVAALVAARAAAVALLKVCLLLLR